MLIVSDTSPVSNLIIIGKLELLENLYGEIVIPPTVYQEILRLNDFGISTKDFENASWIKKISASNSLKINELLKILDKGESEAIILAEELHADWLLIDERLGQKIAADFGIKTIGLLGIIRKAKYEKLISAVKPILDELINEAGFWISDKLYREILKSVDEFV